MTKPALSQRVRLGEFQLDFDAGELIGNGSRIRLQVQSLELLRALLERPGQMVSREELRQRLWPGDTFVDFEHGLNAAVRRLRESLGDSADTPRYVETIPRRGYRLVAATETPASSTDTPAPTSADIQIADAAPALSAPASPRAALADHPADDLPIPGARAAGQGRTVAVALTLVVALVAVAAAASLWIRRAPSLSPRPPVVSFSIDVPTGWTMRVLDTVAVSPDSRHIAFTAVGPDARRALWVRTLAGGAPRALVVEGNPLSPFWSPDGSRIGYFQPGQLAAVSLADTSTQVLTVFEHSLAGLQTSTLSKLDVSDPLLGGAATWMENGDIVFTSLHRPALWRLARGASAASALSLPDVTIGSQMASLHAVPGTDRFTLMTGERGESQRVARIVALGGTDIVTVSSIDSRVVPTGSGHAVFVRDGTLLAQRLDGGRLVGSPTVLSGDVSVRVPTLGQFGATGDVLAYLTRDALRLDMRVVVVDRAGAEIARVGEAGFYSNLRLSPDGTRIAVALEDPRLGTRDIWLHELDGGSPLRLTFDPADDMTPIWAADGATVLFSSDRAGERDLYRKDAAGARPEALVFASPDSKSLNAATRDGRLMIYDTGARGSMDPAGPSSRADLFTVTLDTPPRVRPLATTAAHEAIADLSPDGALVAYHSSETGATEVFVETFPEKRGRWQVTTTGAIEPLWRADGRELFFLTSRNEVASVEVFRSADGVRFGAPRILFTRPVGPVDQVRSYAAFADGRRFVVLIPASAPAPQQISVRVNWRSALLAP
jgi:DNA-binding winged helix-turn-helix (wHTH) protein/Tol biopolymer transport system component